MRLKSLNSFLIFFGFYKSLFRDPKGIWSESSFRTLDNFSKILYVLIPKSLLPNVSILKRSIKNFFRRFQKIAMVVNFLSCKCHS